MTDWLIEPVESLGAPGAGLAIALENLFPPLSNVVIAVVAPAVLAFLGVGLSERRKGRHALPG